MSIWGDQRDFLEVVYKNMPLNQSEMEIARKAMGWKGCEIVDEDFEDEPHCLEAIKHIMGED